VNRSLATLAVALLLVPLVAGCSALPVGKSSPSPSALAQLPAGTHATTAFQPVTTYTVEAGWVNPTDVPDYFNLFPAVDQNNGVHLFHNPQPLSQDPACPSAAQAGVGTSSAELVAWIRSLKGLNVSPPAMVTVSGLPGTQIDVSIHSGWTQSCSFANGLPTVALFYRSAATLGWWVAGDEKLRLFLVDVPNQGTVVIDLDSFDGTGFGDLLTSGSAIVKSLQFAPK
jgi:hypothetical protein